LAEIIGTLSVGGFFGTSISKHIFENCINLGNITTIINSSTNGGTGGIVGAISQGTFINCINAGYIKGSNNVGGLIGIVANSNSTTEILNCINVGVVAGTGENIGCIIGDKANNTIITDCF